MPTNYRLPSDQCSPGFTQTQAGNAYDLGTRPKAAFPLQASGNARFLDLEPVTHLYGQKSALPLLVTQPFLGLDGSSLSKRLQAKIVELAKLPDGWDARSTARAPLLISLFACVTACQQLVEWSTSFGRPRFQEPFLVPNFDGCVQMEWSNSERALEMEARADGWSIAGVVKYPDRDPEFVEGEIPLPDYSSVARCYQWFKGLRHDWPL